MPATQTATRTTHIDIPAKIRAEVITELNLLLADASDLTMQAKQAHWTVRGPNFIALHRLFDEVYEHAGEWADGIAERLAALGGQAKGTLQAAVKATRLDAYPLDLIDEQEHVARLSQSIAKFASYARSDIEKFTDLKDQASADLCTEIVRTADKDLWFVESHLTR
jgi:starvation-inducible DNA-binding protein